MRLFGVIPVPPIRRILKSRWLRVPLIVLGILCIFAAIWFGFPMTGWAPLISPWTRGGVIGAILFVIGLIYFLRWRKRRKAAQALEENLIPEPVGDGKVLAERMEEALTKLKKAGGKTYLYDLPWYIIIGPPGAGKTTALRNSGLEFPGLDDLPDTGQGFGGTRNCDWWFAEEAVLIDTAGRYTSQDSDAEADRASWTAFLDILKRGRANQPINGVILAFSTEDMMQSDAAQLAEQAAVVRERLGELHETLKIDFPVYVLFTKADLISGFREYFSTFSLSRRKAVWGTTFQTKDRSAETYKEVPAEFDALVSRLSDELIDRLVEEPDGVSRIAIFGLPGQMAMLRDNVSEFLRRVFEPTRYKTNAILRGFYFTSGTQEGTPIDQVLGAMSRNADHDTGFQPAFMSGRGKSYFLHDVLRKVIFAERDWVSHDKRAVRRTMVLRAVALSFIGLAALGAMGAFAYSFWQNATLVKTAEAAAAQYADSARNEIDRQLIDDSDMSPVLRHLQQLRLMTRDYGAAEPRTLWQGFGLSQHGEMSLAANAAYSDALEQMMRPRMILHLENTIPQRIADDDTAGVYRALKVYLLLGGQQDGRGDDESIKAFFEEVWGTEFSSIGQQAQRDQLNAHLAAMLELDDDRSPILTIDSAIVDRARGAIVDLPLADQAYSAISDRAATSGVPDFNLVERLAGRVTTVLATTDGSALEDVGVPGLYTFEGYWGFFLEELARARDRLREDRWVLGPDAERVNYEQQLGTLERDLHRRYRLDFQQAWRDMLARITVAPMSVDPPEYETLAATASPVGSPLLELVEAIDEETRLVRLFEQIENTEFSAESIASGDLGASMGDAVFKRIYSRSGVFQRVVLDSVTSGGKSQARAGGGNALAEDSQRRQVERITEDFELWHVLLKGDIGARPVDVILNNLGQLRENRRQAARAPTPMDEKMLQQFLSDLTRNNTALPDPLARLLNDIEAEFRTVAQDATMSQLTRALNDDVAQFCREFVDPLFPFGNGRHLAPSLFGQFFGPNGRMDTFYSNYLQPHVIRTAEGLQPAPDSAIGQRLSPAALKQFERAQKIRLAFFASGSPEPNVNMSVTHLSSSPTVELAVLSVNGKSVRTQPDSSPAALEWPGQSSGVSVELFPQTEGRANVLRISDGRWDIATFLQRGRTRVSGNVVNVTHEIGGRTITYRLEFDSPAVPFLMRELAEFSCPLSLE